MMSDGAKLVLSRWLLGDGTWPGHKFASRFPGRVNAVTHVFYVLRPNGEPWSSKFNNGDHVPVNSLCDRYVRQIGAMRETPRETDRICRNCLRVAGRYAL